MTLNARRIDFQLSKDDYAKITAKHPDEDPKAAVKRIVLDYIGGRKPRDAAQSEMDELRRRKLLLDIREKEETAALRRRKLAAETATAEYHAACLATVGPNPSADAKAAMRAHEKRLKPLLQEDRAKPQGSMSPHERHNNRLFCPECGVLFLLGDTQQTVSGAKERYADHVFKKHGRTLTGFEVEVLRKI